MGFYIRKAFKIGPIRLNLSKSGVGVSAGVKGARYSIGPSGQQIHAGRYGLYYRKRIGKAPTLPTSSSSGSLLGGICVLVVVVMGLLKLLFG